MATEIYESGYREMSQEFWKKVTHMAFKHQSYYEQYQDHFQRSEEQKKLADECYKIHEDTFQQLRSLNMDSGFYLLEQDGQQLLLYVRPDGYIHIDYPKYIKQPK